MSTLISHTLDLAVRLVDTTTGRVVVGQDITLLYDGKRVPPDSDRPGPERLHPYSAGPGL